MAPERGAAALVMVLVLGLASETASFSLISSIPGLFGAHTQITPSRTRTVALCRWSMNLENEENENRVAPPPPPRKVAGVQPPPPRQDMEKPAEPRKAGAWREFINAASAARKVENVRRAAMGEGPDGEGCVAKKIARSAGRFRPERTTKQDRQAFVPEKKPGPPPPPMLTMTEWEMAMSISGASGVQDLHVQLELAKVGDYNSLEMKWLKMGASRAEIKKRLGQAMAVNTQFSSVSVDGSNLWGEGKKFHKPSSGSFYRYMHKQQKFDGKVLPMSRAKSYGISEEQFKPKNLVSRPLLGGAAQQAAAKALPSARSPPRGRGGKGNGKRP